MIEKDLGASRVIDPIRERTPSLFVNEVIYFMIF